MLGNTINVFQVGANVAAMLVAVGGFLVWLNRGHERRVKDAAIDAIAPIISGHTDEEERLVSKVNDRIDQQNQKLDTVALGLAKLEGMISVLLKKGDT